ncbi:MAG: hypothetical protein U1F25_11655 [Rubrivivax sp.]
MNAGNVVIASGSTTNDTKPTFSGSLGSTLPVRWCACCAMAPCAAPPPWAPVASRGPSEAKAPATAATATRRVSKRAR